MLREGKVRKGGLNLDPKTSRPLSPKAQRNKNQIIIAEGKVESLIKPGEMVDGESYYINDVLLDEIVADLEYEVGKHKNEEVRIILERRNNDKSKSRIY